MTSVHDITAIILAGGRGKRMKSQLPKVMHSLAGRPVIRHLTDTLEQMGLGRIVLVVGHGRELLYDEYRNDRIEFALQEQQLGTGDAVKAAAEYFESESGDILVLLGDVPCLRRESLLRLIEEHRSRPVVATVLTCELDDPSGYGRIVRDPEGFVKKIVEHADASNEELRIREINTGIIIFQAPALRVALERIGRDNKQGEYYLTDAVRLLLEEGQRTGAVMLDDYREGLGINSVKQLEEVERAFFATKKVDKKLGES